MKLRSQETRRRETAPHGLHPSEDRRATSMDRMRQQRSAPALSLGSQNGPHGRVRGFEINGGDALTHTTGIWRGTLASHLDNLDLLLVESRTTRIFAFRERSGQRVRNSIVNEFPGMGYPLMLERIMATWSTRARPGRDFREDGAKPEPVSQSPLLGHDHGEVRCYRLALRRQGAPKSYPRV